MPKDMSHVIVRFANVGFRGAVGEFRGDGETFSWHRAAGDGDAEATSFPAMQGVLAGHGGLILLL